MGKIAGAVLDLVSSLGYDRFAVHGTDMGAGIAGQLDTLAAGRVIGLHTGTDGDTAVAVASFMPDASLARTDLTEAQKATLSERFAGMADRNGYVAIQSSRPKTLGYALNDSPIGQLAWVAEKFAAWTDPAKALIEDAVDLDQFLAIVSTYWHGGGGAGSANALWESFKAMGWSAPTATPKGVIAFNADDLTVLMALGPATAVGSDAWESFLVQMDSYESLTATADQFARLLGHEDQEGLDALAKEVAQSLDTDHLALVVQGFDISVLPGEDEAQYFERLSTKVAQLGIFEDASASRVALEGLGACQTAGILLRNLILMVADGTARPNLVEGHLVLDDTGNDWRYAEAFARCQIVGRHELRPSAVGYSQKACQATRQSHCPEIVDR